MLGRQILKLKEARDPNVTEGDFKIGLGFATHTPTKATEQHFFSLQTNKADPTNVWQVYSRKRGYKKQLDMGCADGVNSDTATALSITSPQQQHKVYKDKHGTEHGETTVHLEGTSAQDAAEDANSANIQKQEATALWNMAKELGVTCGSLQRNYVEKIMEMEERDKKKAERLGNRRSTP